MRVLLTVFLLLAATSTAAAELHSGRWRGVLESPGGDLPFGLELYRQGQGWEGWVINGPERIQIGEVRVEGTSVTLDFPHYDANIQSTLGPDGRLLGRYWRQRGGEKFAEMPFMADPDQDWRFSRDAVDNPTPYLGRWAVDLETEAEPAVGIFETGADGVVGTFLTAVGDYRYLAGNVVDGQLRLSVFDGAHAFLFHAILTENGTLQGDFWSSNYWHETWTGVADDEAMTPDAFGQTRWTDGADLSALTFPDLDGEPRALDDPEFSGEARILYVFGSWCPNCADATEYLVELHERYAPRGLSILGLAFEHTGDLERDGRQVRRYAQRHGVTYPLLLAGLSDKAEATKALPILDKVRAYPTTIFLDGDGAVRAIHTGFSGPANEAAYRALRGKFEAILEETLPADAGR